ncbi:MAG: tetratricopeptide repeat protein [Nanoarchaeota archaeon]|nr:tetratricopeptide repeat protein [Nanoarchaeota archaeon]
MDSLLNCIGEIESVKESSFEPLFHIVRSVLKNRSPNLLERIKKAVFEDTQFAYAKTGMGFPAFLRCKQGDCLDFSLIFYFLFRHFRVHTEMLAVPDHTIVRFFEQDKGQIVEATDGSLETAEFYITSRKIHPQSILNHIYLSALQDNQILAIYANNKTRQLIQNKDYALALDMLNLAYGYCAAIPEVCYNLGYVYRQSGKLDNAKNFFSQAIKLHPNFLKAYNELGICYALEGDSKSAEFYFLKSLSITRSYEAETNLLRLKHEPRY